MSDQHAPLSERIRRNRVIEGDWFDCRADDVAELEHTLELFNEERDSILDALPDSATCKHDETGESLVDNIRDLVGERDRLRVRAAEDKKRLDEIASALLGKPLDGYGWTYVPDTLAPEIATLRRKARAFDEIWPLHTGSVDGCDIEEIAVKHGAVEAVLVAAPCNDESCECAAIGNLPGTCYRLCGTEAVENAKERT